MPDMLQVVFHRPGPTWNAALPPFEQDGLDAHVEHFGHLHALGKLVLGGPFADATAGGMMVLADLTEHEAQVFAASDPAVLSGLLIAEVRPWRALLRGAT